MNQTEKDATHDDEATQRELTAQSYQNYLDYRTQINNYEHELDKAIATANIAMAGGAILISITLVGDWMIARTSFISLLLVLSWITLVGSLVFTLLALKNNKDGHQEFCKILDDHTINDINKGLAIAQAEQAAHPINRKIKRYQNWQVRLTIAGIVLLLGATYIGVTTPV